MAENVLAVGEGGKLDGNWWEENVSCGTLRSSVLGSEERLIRGDIFGQLGTFQQIYFLAFVTNLHYVFARPN